MANKHAKEEKEKAIEALKRSFNAVASTPDGIAVLRYIMKDCGFFKTSTVMNPATFEINTIGTVWNEARRDVYRRLRGFIDKDKLIQIEFEED